MAYNEKKELIAQLYRDASDKGTAFSILSKILNTYIDDCHIANETNRGENFIHTQGQIDGFRKILKILNPKTVSVEEKE